jgi:hypothetical protein
LPDLSDDPAGSLYGQPDEDFWANGIALPTFCRAEAPPRPYLPQPYLPDPEEIPAGTLHAQPDEDFWANPVAPVPPRIYQSLPYLPDPTDDPAGSLLKFPSPDEDYWQLPQIAQVAQMSLGLYQALPIAAGEPGEIVPATVLAPDEDFWSPYAAASGDGQPFIAQILQASMALYQRLPYLPEPTDDPAGTLYGQPDEDFWANPLLLGNWKLETGNWMRGSTTQFQFSNFQFLPYLPDVSDDPAGSLHGQPDEDFWANPVAPVAPNIWQPLPIAAGEPGELIVPLPPDEDFWENAVAPVAASIYQPLPICGGDTADMFPPGHPDEDFWMNPVAPIAPGMYQELPYAAGESAELEILRPLPRHKFIELPRVKAGAEPARVKSGTAETD